MRIFLSVKYHEDMSNRAFVESLCAMLEADGHEVLLVVRDLEEWGARSFTTQALMAATFQMIDSADCLLAEQSEKGTGLGIEAGYAYARGIPVLALAREGCELSPTLTGIAAFCGSYQVVEEIPGLVKSAFPAS